MKKIIELEHYSKNYQKQIQKLIGLTASLPWKGYGSAIFIELGELQPLESTRARHKKGQACLSIEWDWRIEKGCEVFVGSSNSKPKMEKGIQALKGAYIEEIIFIGDIKELEVRFSNGMKLKSMIMNTGYPAWSIRLLTGKYIHAEAGKIIFEKLNHGLSTEEEMYYALADNAATRWGEPFDTPKKGCCDDCLYFVPIDGEGSLIDYGVCITEKSKFDGQVVNMRSGCPIYRD